jgi:hypothetical protein
MRHAIYLKNCFVTEGYSSKWLQSTAMADLFFLRIAVIDAERSECRLSALSGPSLRRSVSSLLARSKPLSPDIPEKQRFRDPLTGDILFSSTS